MLKPECISAHAARATARAARSTRPATARRTRRHIRRWPANPRCSSAPWCKHGTRRVGLSAATSRANSGVSSGITRSANSRPQMFHQDPGTQRPRRIVLVAHGQQHFVQPASPVPWRHDSGAVRAICFDLDNTLWEIEPVLVRAERILADWLQRRYPQIPRTLLPRRHVAVREALLREQPHQAHDLTFLRRETLARLGRSRGLRTGRWRTRPSRSGTRRATSACRLPRCCPRWRSSSALSARHAHQRQCRSRDDRHRAPF